MPGHITPHWEFGSEFHWAAFDTVPGGPILPPDAVLFASGRDALRALIEEGVGRRGWRRWFVPSYFCQEVAATIASGNLEVVLYEDSPLWPAPAPLQVSPQRGDVFFLVNYFGLRDAAALETLDLGPAELVEDHTHDPWSDWALSSRADYCIVSLRKTLPLPDGGAVWSPRSHSLPRQRGAAAEQASISLMKLGSMILKSLYLDGHAVDKEAFRRLQADGEKRISSGRISGASRFVEQLLPTLPWDVWRSKRRANYAALAKALSDLAGIEVLSPFGDTGSCPFSVILRCDGPRLRDSVRSSLIADAVYPAILWPIESGGVPSRRTAEELSRQILSLHCDFRYEVPDLQRVAAAVRRALESFAE